MISIMTTITAEMAADELMLTALEEFCLAAFGTLTVKVEDRRVAHFSKREE